MESELYEICDQLRRDAGGRKVMICGSDGEVTVHAGDAGAFDEETGEAVASVVADVLVGASGGQPSEDVVAVLPRALSVCAAPLGTRAVLVVLYDAASSIDRVRVKMRRAREQLLKVLPSDAGKGTPKTS
jgi:predicted regulator of Ras-like GTPase activity (Roadblock/LC7/MglB family)